MPIPVIDLFAGPGGLGEGFESVGGSTHFKIKLSVEKDPAAHKTLVLRSFFRQFNNQPPADYFAYLRGEISKETLFSRHPTQAESAHRIAWLAELGCVDEKVVDKRINNALDGNKPWVLIGGPPCQAYSLAGRSRNKGVVGYKAEDDHRHFLYREYLRILAVHQPDIFVMENVKGILSSRIDGQLIFPKILDDLRTPQSAVASTTYKKGSGYRLYSFSTAPTEPDLWDAKLNPTDFIIKSEDFGIPQRRHRVIIFGIRENSGDFVPGTLQQVGTTTVNSVLRGLSPLRSGLSKGSDTTLDWQNLLKSFAEEDWVNEISDDLVREKVLLTSKGIKKKRAGRGGEFLKTKTTNTDFEPGWFGSPLLGGVCNHSTRGHIAGDLRRYMFASAFGKVHRKSPTLRDFPVDLLPDHKNANRALEGNLFSDRFRVQIGGQPATTITSHISKDGHYFIHPDPTQCRSLTVREAARIQTFPDDYFFEGPRTAQYVQVGNAVPPLLAQQLGKIVMQALARSKRRAA